MSEAKNVIDLANVAPSLVNVAASPEAPEASLPAPEDELSADPNDPVGVLLAMMDKIERSVAGLHIVIRASSARIAQLEAHMAYLLSKDDKAGAHIRAIQAAAAAEPEKKDESGAQV